MKTYWEKLKDPRWQKMRLKVMETANFECVDCGDSESTLNVHHSYYKKSADPWDYEMESLQCLCEDCHKRQHHETNLLTSLINQVKVDENCNTMYVCGFLSAYLNDGPYDLVLQVDGEFLTGVASFYEKTFNETYNKVRVTSDGVHVIPHEEIYNLKTGKNYKDISNEIQHKH